MKKAFIIALTVILMLLLIACGSSASKPSTQPTSTPIPTASPSSVKNTSSSTSGAVSSTSKSTFTNAYGTSTTKCAHPGCNNYIAPSGDTNCCTTHSKKCLNCGKYIDEDAMYCMDCISHSVTSNSSNNGSNYNSGKKTSNSSSANNQNNGYDMPKDGETFADYVKRVDPDLYRDIENQYNTAIENGW